MVTSDGKPTPRHLKEEPALLQEFLQVMQDAVRCEVIFEDGSISPIIDTAEMWNSLSWEGTIQGMIVQTAGGSVHEVFGAEEYTFGRAGKFVPSYWMDDEAHVGIRNTAPLLSQLN